MASFAAFNASTEAVGSHSQKESGRISVGVFRGHRSAILLMSRKTKFEPNWQKQTEAHVVCIAQTLSAAHSLPNMSARHSAAKVEA